MDTKNYGNKRKLFWAIFLIPFFSFSQIIIQGTVYNGVGKAVPNVSISISDIQTKNIFAYAISNNKGEYYISVNSLADSLQISIRGMGYASKSKTIKNHSQVQNFVLSKKVTKLEEVIINPPVPISQKGDTINYQVSSFAQKQDRSIADVLERMPGIEVKADGQILYQGTPINKYYIEGLDLLGGRYKLANENLPFKEVAKVQILENHQPIKMLDSLVFSNKAALNIKLKNKHTFTGGAKIGSGFSPLLWNVNLTPMLFSHNRQMLLSYQTNNTGDNIASQIQRLTPEDFENNTGKQYWLSIQKLDSPNFSQNRWLDNNAHLLSLNILQKLKKDYQLRLNVSYLNDYQQQEGYSKNLFFTPTDTIPLTESIYNQLYFNNVKADISFKRNTKKNYLKNRLRFQGSWENQRGNIQQNSEPLHQNLRNRYFDLSNHFNIIFPVGKQLMNLDSYIDLSRTPQVLRVRPGQFENLFNKGAAYEEIVQNIDLNRFFTNNSLGFTKGAGYFTFSPKMGFQFENQNLESDITIDGAPALGKEFANHLDWRKSKTYFHLQSQFKKEKWRISFDLPLNFYSYQIEDRFLQKEQKLNRFSFEPRLGVRFYLNTSWKLGAAAGLSNNFGSINQLHYAYILQNYRNLQRIEAPLPEIFGKFIHGSVSYRNPLKLLFGKVQYSFNQSEHNLLYQNDILPNGTTQINAIEKENRRKGHRFSGRISKYFSGINTSLTINANYNFQKFRLILNNQLTTIQNQNKLFGAKIETDIANWLGAEYQTSLLFANNQVQAQKNRTFKQQSHQLNLNFHVRKHHYLGVKTEYVTNNFFSVQDQQIFSNILYRYSLEENNIDFELSYTNIFNTKSYQTINTSEYSYVETNYKLRPSQLLLTVRLSL